uniref:WAP domain-containing protein n=1 Tax=Sciurus vulgaris TaxID=55149 RepID=A0A8D2B9X8_SCIVU
SPACPLCCNHDMALGAKGLAHLSPVAAPKTGSCPWVGEQISQLCQEQDQCSNDSQCEGNKKCCFSRCAMRCLDPILGMFGANSSCLPVTSTSSMAKNGQ